MDWRNKMVHTDSNYSSMFVCECDLCKEVQKCVAENKKSATRQSIKLTTAMIKLALFTEVSFYMRDMINKEKKLELIFNNIVKSDISFDKLNIMWDEWPMDDIVNYFQTVN